MAVLRKGKIIDEIKSYFAIRKISLGMGKDGVQRVLLNNKFLFRHGPPDQGWWPDGLSTAPADEALKFDIVRTKGMSFNLIRKHIKVEPARWYPSRLVNSASGGNYVFGVGNFTDVHQYRRRSLHYIALLDEDYHYKSGTNKTETLHLAKGLHHIRLFYKINSNQVKPGITLQWAPEGKLFEDISGYLLSN